MTPSGGLGLGYNGGRRLLFWHQPLVAAAAEWRSRELPQLPGSLLHPCPHALPPQPGHLCQGPPSDWFDIGDILRRNPGRKSMQRREGAAGRRIQLKCTSLTLLVVINTTVNDFMQCYICPITKMQSIAQATLFGCLNSRSKDFEHKAFCGVQGNDEGSSLTGSCIWGEYICWFHKS